MPWRGVTVSEPRERFLEDHQLNYYSVGELAERFSISRKTAHKWAARFEARGHDGYQELSRRPHSCPWQTEAAGRPGARWPAQGAPALGPSWAPRPDGPTAPAVGVAGGVDGGPDLGGAGVGPAEAAL